MPELPEVETIRRDLEPELVGRSVLRARIHKPDIVMPPDSAAHLRRAIRGARFTAVSRRGKNLLFELDQDRILHTQLRMTGRFAIGVAPPEADGLTHIAAEFDLSDGRRLYYDDVRRLGGIRLLDGAAWREIEKTLGPEPLDRAFTARRLAEALAGSRAPVKNALLDQRRLAGVGNIYASEALHRARLDPRRPAGSLSQDELRALHRELRRVLTSALEHAGTTFRDYRAVNGRSGRFQTSLRVYGKEGTPCGRCGGELLRIVQAGRSTFFCASCQR